MKSIVECIEIAPAIPAVRKNVLRLPYEAMTTATCSTLRITDSGANGYVVVEVRLQTCNAKDLREMAVILLDTAIALDAGLPRR